MRRIDIAESILSRQLTWIASSDSKASFIFPVAAAMLGVLAAVAPSPTAWSVSSGIFASIATILLLLCIGFCALSAFPRTHGPKGSVVFCEGICSKELAQYESELLGISEENYLSDLARQIHINASIAASKFGWIKRSLLCLFVSALPWALSIYLLYIQHP